MTNQWDFYLARVNGKPASIFLDMRLHNRTPDSLRTQLHWLFVKLSNPNPHGMTTSAEAQILGEIEDTLNPELLTVSSVFAGRVTTDGRREFYYYAPMSEGVEPIVARVLRRWPSYVYQYGTKPDPDWTQYRDVIYPSAEDRQRISNRHMVTRIKEAGDRFETRRPVSHWVNFADAAQRAAFVTRMEALGFKSELSEFEGERPFGASVEKLDSVATIDSAVIVVFRVATELGGEYDGWESPIMAAAGDRNKPLSERRHRKR